MKLQDLRQADELMTKLKSYSHKIHRQDENACNYGLTKWGETRLANLINEVKIIAKEWGLYIYHQGDPRGCSLYLGDKPLNESNYTEGLPIC